MTGKSLLPLDRGDRAITTQQATRTVRATDTFVEVRDADDNAWCVPLRSDHVVVGRSPFAGVVLDRSSVSRRHAELLRDPFGRWWVRDLGGRGGVIVNGVPVEEVHIQPGDEIQISRFTLTFNRTTARSPRAADIVTPPTVVSSVAYDDTAETRIQTREEVAAPKIDVLHLTTLTEFGQRLTGVESAAERLRLLCRFMVRKDFHGLAAMALRHDKKAPEDPLQVLVSQTERHTTDESNYVSRSVIETVQRTHAAVIASNAPHDTGVVELSTPGDVGRIATIACPLHEDARVFDLLYVIFPSDYGTAEWLALVELAIRQYQQAENVWRARDEAKLHAAIEQDLASARKIQLSIVPKHLAIEGLDIAIDFQPSRWVGGDYIDVIAMKDGRTLVVAADVSGKGLSAALVAQSLHSMVHACLANGVPVIDMMHTINAHMHEYLEEGSFVTMTCVALDPRSGELECVNAGHLPAMIIDGKGQRRDLQVSKHLPLGLDAISMQFDKDRLETGQLLVLYTDGLTEIPRADHDGRLIGVEGLSNQLCSVCRATRAESAHDVASRLTEWLNDLENGRLRRDDRSFVMVRRTG